MGDSGYTAALTLTLKQIAALVFKELKGVCTEAGGAWAGKCNGARSDCNMRLGQIQQSLLVAARLEQGIRLEPIVIQMREDGILDEGVGSSGDGKENN